MQNQGEELLRTMFIKAWQDGKITDDERALLVLLRNTIEMAEGKFTEMEATVKTDAYHNAMRTVWKDGAITPEESDFLQSLRQKLGVSAEEHFAIESQVRKEMAKK
jgi:uncharacterized membrane protein YebE (DUF533 family)